METVLVAHCYGLDGVKQPVLRLTEPARSVKPLNGSAITALTSTPVEWPDVEQFDRLFWLDEELAERVTAIAKTKHMSSQKPINGWLREKVLEYAKAG